MAYIPNVLLVPYGGTSLTSINNHSVMVGAGQSSITQLAIGSHGQVLIGATGADPAFATLTSSDSTVTFTPGVNTLSIQVANPVLSSEVTLTHAQIILLRSAPITVVTAPGSGNTIHFVGAQLKMVYGGTNVYTNPQDLSIRYTNGSGVIVSSTITGAGFEDPAVSTYTSATAIPNAIVAATAAEAQPLVIHNIGGSEIAGNAAANNTIVVTVYYQVLTQ